MLRRRPSLIVFDLDGTLVDSAPDLACAIDTLLVRLGRRPAGEEKVRGWIGNGMPMLVRRALTGEQWPDHDPDGFSAALALYMDIYGASLSTHSRLYSGTRYCLEQLQQQDIPLACVTNKNSRFTRPLLEQLGILEFFAAIASGDEFRNHKPDPEPLVRIAERQGVGCSDALMVGDSPADAGAARNAGFMLACVSYGYHGGNGVKVLEPDVILDSLAELPGLVEAAPV